VRRCGQGRFVYAPAWDVHQPWNIDDWCAIWPEVLPVKDRALFRRTIDDAAGGAPLSFRAEGNDAVFLEGIVPAEGRKRGLDLHFINYHAADTAPEMTVRVALPAGATGATIERIRADVEGHPAETLDAVVEGREAVSPCSPRASTAWPSCVSRGSRRASRVLQRAQSGSQTMPLTTQRPV